MYGFIIMFGKWEPDRLKKARPREMRVHARGRGPRVLSILLQHRRKRRLQLTRDLLNQLCPSAPRRNKLPASTILGFPFVFVQFDRNRGGRAGGWGLEKKDKSEGPTAGDSSMNK